MYSAVIFVFFVTLFIVLCFSSISPYGNLDGFFCSRIFVFSVCNTIICAILVESGNKSAEDLDGLMTLLGFRVYEEGEDEEEEEENEEITDGWIDDDDDDNDDDDDDDDDDSYDGSDGYDSDIELSSDENDNNSDSDSDSDSDYDNLESRIEEFIAKMSKMWREELMMEKSTN
ncbi:hypothetical protein ACP275_05G094000 [Erythranthe tilingii]